MDASLLYFLVEMGLNALFARFFSFAVAVLVTWYLNSSWTFRTALSSDRYIKYVGLQFFGVSANYGIFALTLSVVGQSAEKAVVALAIGSLAGLAVNYCGARWFVFTRSM